MYFQVYCDVLTSSIDQVANLPKAERDLPNAEAGFPTEDDAFNFRPSELT